MRHNNSELGIGDNDETGDNIKTFNIQLMNPSENFHSKIITPVNWEEYLCFQTDGKTVHAAQCAK